MMSSLVIVLVFAFQQVSAQKISVAEYTKNMSLGNVPAQGVSIYRVDEKIVLKNYSKYVSKYKASSDVRKGEMKAVNAKIKSLSADSIHIYANTEIVSKNEVRLFVFVLHKNQWLNQSSPIVQTINNDLYAFAVNESRKPVEKNIKVMIKNIDDMQKNIESTKKENARLKKDIELYKKNIKNSEDMISENEKLISSNIEEIEDWKKQLAELQEQLKNIK